MTIGVFIIIAEGVTHYYFPVRAKHSDLIQCYLGFKLENGSLIFFGENDSLPQQGSPMKLDAVLPTEQAQNLTDNIDKSRFILDQLPAGSNRWSISVI